jgi:hypothetical protein
MLMLLWVWRGVDWALCVIALRATSRFFPDANRADAEAMLKKTRAGSFLVRKSNYCANPPIIPAPVWYAFALKKRDNTIWNALIQSSRGHYRMSVSEVVGLGSSKKTVHRFEYKSLDELIVALLTDQELISLANLPDRLILPC